MTLRDQTDSRAIDRPVTDFPHIHQSTSVHLKAWEVMSPSHDALGNPLVPRSRIYVGLAIDAMCVEQASGRTLGEAIMHLGALMVGETLLPVERIRPFLEAPR